jgi:protein-disulfide isomerase
VIRVVRSLLSVAVPTVVALALALASASVTRSPGPRLVTVADHVPAALEGAGVSIGPGRGTLTVRVVGDYECSACEALDRRVGRRLRALAAQGRIRYQLVQAPLRPHRRAPKAAAALFCADRQGDPWRMHTLLVEGRAEWGWGEDPHEAFRRYARRLDLAVDEFQKCLASPYASLRLEADRSAAAGIGVAGVPVILVGATLVTPTRSFTEVLDVVEARLADR